MSGLLSQPALVPMPLAIEAEVLSEFVIESPTQPGGASADATISATPALSDAGPASLPTSSPLPAVSERPPSPEFLGRLSHDFSRRHLLLSAGWDESVGREHLLVSDRTRPAVILNVAVRLGRAVQPHPTDAEQIAIAIDRAYAAHAAREQRHSSSAADDSIISIASAADLETELAAAVRDAERDLLNTDNKAPSVKLVDLILFEALQRSASDVHIQPLSDRTLVRYRLDGALHTARELPASIASSVVSRMKVMANLDVAERRAPQDGRAGVSIGGSGPSAGTKQGANGARRIDLRVSTLPSTYGERVVLRLLDPARSSHLLSFGGLGMPATIRDRFLDQVARVSGIVLSTGPTGSGKTTTLYTTLAWVSATNATARGSVSASSNLTADATLPPTLFPHSELNILTIEDPVEYDLSSSANLHISQTQVDPKKNVTFATGLRHILRQDPDVIMVGEIRDEETARMAVQASLTGHLVLSTLHTNDAASAIARLVDLGVEPFLVSSSLAAVLAQRLVRQLHAECPGAANRGRVGCETCHFTGFKGRTGVFELLVVDAPVRDLIAQRVPAAELKALAVTRGMATLRQAGAALVERGITTQAEVARAIESPEEADA